MKRKTILVLISYIDDNSIGKSIGSNLMLQEAFGGMVNDMASGKNIQDNRGI